MSFPKPTVPSPLAPPSPWLLLAEATVGLEFVRGLIGSTRGLPMPSIREDAPVTTSSRPCA